MQHKFSALRARDSVAVETGGFAAVRGDTGGARIRSSARLGGGAQGPTRAGADKLPLPLPLPLPAGTRRERDSPAAQRRFGEHPEAEEQPVIPPQAAMTFRMWPKMGNPMDSGRRAEHRATSSIKQAARK